MVFAEKNSCQEGRKETETKKSRGTSRSTISSNIGCSDACSIMDCSTSTVDHSDDETEEDADERGGGV